MNGTSTLLEERIRYFRKVSGLSQDELATKADIAMMPDDTLRSLLHLTSIMHPVRPSDEEKEL